MIQETEEERTDKKANELEKVDFNDTLSDVADLYSGKYREDEENVIGAEKKDLVEKSVIEEDGVKYSFINNVSQPKSPEYSPTPLIKNQKDFPQLRRIYARRVTMFDLGKKEEEEALNNLMDKALKEDSNIIDLNLRHEFSEKSGSWKILATYSLVEFKTDINKK